MSKSNFSSIFGNGDAGHPLEFPMHARGSTLLKSFWLGGVALIVSAATPAIAQDQVEDVAEERSNSNIIIVTAQRREQNLQDVPQSITAFTEDGLDARSLNNAAELSSFVPNLTTAVNVGNLQVSLRGVGETVSLNPSGDAAVAVYIDNVYQTRPSASALDTIFDNLERVEVLRGPQGTLYGRNSTGGVLHLITKAPTKEFSGYINGGFDEFETVALSAGVSGAIADGLRVAVNGSYSDQNQGYSRNAFLGVDLNRGESWRVGGAIYADLADNLELRIRADHNELKRAGPHDQYPVIMSPIVLAFGGGTVSPNPRITFSNRFRQTEVKSTGVSAELIWEQGPILFKSITGYRATKNSTEGLDFDGVELPLLNTDPAEEGRQFSQEVIFSPTDPGALEWVAGLFYLQDNFDTESPSTITGLFLPPPFGPNPNLFIQNFTGIRGGRTTAFGIFADLTYNFSEQLSVTLGGRWNQEDRAGDFYSCGTVRADQFATVRAAQCESGSPLLRAGSPVYLSTSSSEPTGRIVLTYKPSDDLLTYASVSRGTRAGGINNSGPNTFNPEFLWAYEAGLKSQPMDNLQLNLAAFYYDYKDIQAQLVLLQGSRIVNAGSAEYKGAEVELLWTPSNEISVDFQASWLDAEYTDFAIPDSFSGLPVNLAGNKAPRSPEFKTHLGLQYVLPLESLDGSIAFRGDWSWSDSYFHDIFNLPQIGQEAYHRFDARISFKPDNRKFEFSVYGKNLTNKDIVIKGTSLGGGINIGLIGLAPPRIFGAELKFRFGG